MDSTDNDPYKLLKKDPTAKIKAKILKHLKNLKYKGSNLDRLCHRYTDCGHIYFGYLN